MKTKIAFIQEEVRTRQGIMALSAVLKANGHTTEVFCTDEGHEKTLEDIKRFGPHIAGFSTSTPAQGQALEFARLLKMRMKNVLIIMGGPHATFYPQVLEENPCLDGICIGEGEHALLELADSKGDPDRIHSIKNLWVRKSGKIIKNEPRPLIRDLDGLPDSDGEIYFKKYPSLANAATKIFMVGRGCPFPCTYCFNKKYMDIYRDSGNYVRFKSPRKIFSEIDGVRSKYPIKWIQFNDDTFNTNRQWMYDFLTQYKERVGIGFLCNLRIDFIDEELVRRLKEAGVDKISIGVEHGNEEFRRKFLKRNISNEQILEAGRLFKAYGIRFQSGNIVGFPGETMEMAFETVRINQKIMPENATCGVLQPFPGTEIYDYAVQNGFLEEGVTIDDFKAQKTWTSGHPSVRSLIKNENMRQLVNLHCFFDIVVRHPILEPAVRFLIKLPPNRFYQFISQWGQFKIYWKFASSYKEKAGLLKRALSVFWKKG